MKSKYILIAYMLLGVLALPYAMSAEIDDDEDQAEELRLEDMTLRELRKYQSFVYLGGGRDPMTMHTLDVFTAEMTGAKKLDRDIEGLVDSNDIHAELDGILEELRGYILLRSYDEALARARDTLDVAEKQWLEIDSLDDSIAKVRDYYQLAQMMIARTAAEEELNVLGLNIQGVSFSPSYSVVYINGAQYSSGDRIVKGKNIAIEAIDYDSVVFTVNGYTFRQKVRRDEDGNVLGTKVKFGNQQIDTNRIRRDSIYRAEVAKKKKEEEQEIKKKETEIKNKENQRRRKR